MPRTPAANDRMVLRTKLRESNGSLTVKEALQVCTKPGKQIWTLAQIREAVDWDSSHPDRRAQIKFVSGGRALRLVENSQRVGLGQGAKGEVVRAIRAESRIVLSTFGHKGEKALNVRAIETGQRAGPEHGRHSRPDIVVGAYTSGSMRRPILHNIEFEGRSTSGGNTFSISDIAQAFTSGRGADYSWVMIHKSARRFKNDKNYDEWEKVLWFAGTLGVGLILYSDPRRVATWTRLFPAKRKARDSVHSKNYMAWFKRLNDEDEYPNGK